MIIGFIGDIGSGKTISMTYFAYAMHKSGITIYSNYHLEFPHKRIDEIKDINEIETPRNALLLDEIWITADSRKSMQYQNMMLSTTLLQSRKKHIDVLYTTQYMSQVDVRIRNITNLLIQPTIIIRDSMGIPMTERLTILERNFYGDMVEKKTVNLFLYGTHAKYNTDELITKTTTNQYAEYTKKYKDYTGKKVSLVAKLIIDDGVSKSDAELIANYVNP